MKLTSFNDNATAVVLGASGGLGEAFVRQLCDDQGFTHVFGLTRRPNLVYANPKVTALEFDLAEETTIKAAAETINKQAGQVDLVILATGILHDDQGLAPEKTWRSLERGSMERVFLLNTIGPALVAKHFLPLLPKDGKSVFAALSARVGSISDNELGGWHSYRASKAALNMMIRNFAIELERTRPEAICVGLHPGTVDTDLSKPFQGNVPDGKLFTPAQSAEYLFEVIDGLDPTDSGNTFAWDGLVIPS